MSHRFAIVAEAAADHRLAMNLADRVFLETIPSWLDQDILPYQREWITEILGKQLTWIGIRKLAESAGIEAEGFFEGEPGLPDARAARRALMYLMEIAPELDAVLLIRDQDDQPERQQGLEQARRSAHEGRVIVIGLAKPEREAWVLSGFDPRDEAETERLETERTNLGFCPREQLTAGKDDSALRSPKRVLRALTNGDFGREERCWNETRLDLLRKRGERNGLAEYLNEVKSRLATLLGHVENP
jgi:hypothetical protein